MIAKGVHGHVPSRPGILYHGGDFSGASATYTDHLLTILHYGSKVAGLLIVPPEWVPPFAALPAWISEEWQLDQSGWIASAKDQGVDITEALQRVTVDGRYRVIVRSSAVGEGLEDRGQYESILLDEGAASGEVIRAIEQIFSGLAARARHSNMGICLQRYMAPEFLGHVSNEVRLSASRNQWKYEVERPGYVPAKGLNSKFAHSPPENEPPRVRTQKSMTRALRGVCHWVNLRVGNRCHVEWCVSFERLWILQLDEESPTSAGQNPHQMPSTHFGNAVAAPKDFSCFKLHDIRRDTDWKKLNNIRDFWIADEPPKHRLYFATADELKEALADPTRARKLAQEIDHLTSSRAVLRTDCRDPKLHAFNLPRTHTVSGREAAKWLAKTIREMEAKGAAAKDVAFILHQYIPARAAAWSYYDPGDSLVRIDCLWGLPDGLQFLSHDSFEMDARTGMEVSAEVRFKRNFLQEQPDGTWKYVRIARQFARDRVLSSAALRHIALQTVAVAKRLTQRTQIMWFCDLPPELNLGPHLPWYRSRDFSTHTAVERPPLRVRQVETLHDIDAVSREEGRCILQLQPTADLIRADDQYLDKVVEVARERNLPVELPGSTLGHAYYRLRDAGVLVLTAEPKYQRARGRTAHRKLVRDAIPANIAAGGERVSFGRLAKHEAITALVGKLFEEGLEVSGATDRAARLEELADVLEVLRGLAALDEIHWQEVGEAADAKREKRGGFERQTVLLETELPKSSKRADGLMTSEGDLEAVVPLQNIGLASVSEGHLTVPFTRIVPERGLSADVPFEGSTIQVTIRAAGGGISISMDRVDEESQRELQPDLFGTSVNEPDG
jgi:predicted house-cleaning noncanonical NTP pyrophosphatase (MazG superfamily)